MDPKDIPSQYGGQLKFQWGDLPHLDDEAQAAIEKDGKAGWIQGPCLWLDHKRIVVGSEKGKPRRSVPDVEKMKPVVYAADDTEEPVHPNRRGSSVTSQTIKEKAINGTTTAKLEKIQSENVVPATAQVAVASAVPAETNVIAKAGSTEHAPAPNTTVPSETAPPTESVPAAESETKAPAPAESKTDAPAPATAIPSHIPAENVRSLPGGQLANLPPPSEQSAFPQQTAEYIQSAHAGAKTTDQQSAPAPPPAEQKQPSTVAAGAAAGAGAVAVAGAAAVTAGAATEAAAPPALTNGVKDTPDAAAPQQQPPTSTSTEPAAAAAAPHAPAMPQPGPTPQHQVAVTKAVAEKLAGGGDSVSTVPAAAGVNGSLAHPEVIVSSDKAKGLAVESEKVEALPVASRPAMDRFVTAAEF